MERNLLNLVPKKYRCPSCGNWHEWKHEHPLGYYTPDRTAEFSDIKLYPKSCAIDKYTIYVDREYLYYSAEMCGRAVLDLDGKIPIDSIKEGNNSAVFNVDVTLEEEISGEMCDGCSFKSECNLLKLDQGDHRHRKLLLGFEFDPSEYQLCKQEHEEEEEHEEEDNMVNSTFFSKLYENSPKENFENLKAWAEKYKPALRWAVPTVAVYTAYRILKSSDLSVNNIADKCEEALGFKMDFLEDKKTLKELMVIGGLSAGAYGAVKAVSTFASKQEVSIEEMEIGMKQIDRVSKKFAWILPKTEAMLPVALSVIVVYSALHKFKWTDSRVKGIMGELKIKFDTYIELAKLFIQDKWKLNACLEEDSRKIKICILLIVIMALLAFLYGRKVVENKQSDKESINKFVGSFVEQAKAIIQKIAPTAYTTVITWLIAQKILHLEEEEISEGFEEAEEDDEYTDIEIIT